MVEVGKVPFEKVTIACLPFMIPLMLVWILLTFIPGFSLWLPDLILGPE
jgi:TRAP-type C4-dicarboxylate transport system permease large subunit